MVLRGNIVWWSEAEKGSSVHVAAPVCPVCSGLTTVPTAQGHDTRFGNPDVYSIMGCETCGHLFTWPMPNRETLKDLYINNYVDKQRLNLSVNVDCDVKRLGAHYNRLTHWAWGLVDGHPDLFRYIKPGKVLDYGCNTGESLPLLASFGCVPYGLEFNPDAAQQAGRFGYEIFVGPIEETGWPNEFFDTVVLSQVVEHLPSPIEHLRKIYIKIRAGGILLIACPNVHSFYRRLFGMRWAHWHLPFHLHHFSHTSLRRVLDKAGFCTRRLFTVTPGYWVIMSWRVFRHDRRGYRNCSLDKRMAVGKRLLLAPLNRAIDLFGKGDCLVAVSEKRGG